MHQHNLTPYFEKYVAGKYGNPQVINQIMLQHLNGNYELWIHTFLNGIAAWRRRSRYNCKLNNLIWTHELERLHEWLRHKDGQCTQPVQFIVTFRVVLSMETTNVLQHKPIIVLDGFTQHG